MNDLVAIEKIAQGEKLKALVLDSVSSPITKRVYNMALNEFMAWFSSRKLERLGTDFDKPFREVAADLRELIFSAFPAGEQSPEKAAGDPVVIDPSGESSAASSGTGAVGLAESARGKARSDWLDSQITAHRWASDTDIASAGGPSYNTIQR
jgi:hypothetical protein